MKCVVCDADPMVSVWTDLHGEVECTRCGTPFMLKGYNDCTETVCAIAHHLIPLLRAYWSETHRPSGAGTHFPLLTTGGVIDQRRAADRQAFNDWYEAHKGYTERWETDEPGEGMAFRVTDQEWDLDADPPVRIIRKIEFLTYGPVMDSPWPIIGVTPADEP